jgi:hypothetical protein
MMDILTKDGDLLTMGYFDYLDNDILNKYQKNPNNRKKNL